MDTISEYLCHEWVDEVFVKISETEPYPQKLIDEIITMGLTVHLSLGEMEKSLSGKNFIEKIGGYSVITSSINTASPKELLYKRLMDIAGGIVGCLLTVILIVVIGPMIYIKSPGPIFFSQVRIGKNGKKFKIYKFRSMYMDAEETQSRIDEARTKYGWPDVQDGLRSANHRQREEGYKTAQSKKVSATSSVTDSLG